MQKKSSKHFRIHQVQVQFIHVFIWMDCLTSETRTAVLRPHRSVVIFQTYGLSDVLGCYINLDDMTIKWSKNGRQHILCISHHCHIRSHLSKHFGSTYCSSLGLLD